MADSTNPGADVRSAPSGALLPTPGVPPMQAGGQRLRTTRRSDRAPYKSNERVRIARFAERATIYAYLSARPGVALTHYDVAAGTGIDRRVASQQVNSIFDHPEDYPHLERPARGTIRYVGPPREGPLVGAGAPLAVATPDPPPTAPAAPTGPQDAPDMFLVSCVRPVPGGWLVMDDDTGVSYVLRRATAADLRGA
jgi:hypothetical protein